MCLHCPVTSFLKGNQWGMDLGERGAGEVTGSRGSSGNSGWDVTYERRINKNK